MKILIIDDIEENLYLLETVLKGSGYEVVTARDGVEALAKLKEESIDLIISDILMPRMDGFQFCRECKKDQSFKDIPFIFYTATYTDKKDEEFALSLGADKFILKPQEPEAFIKILNEVIKENKRREPIAPKKPAKEEELYLTEYNKRLVQKLEKKMLNLEKANKILQEKQEKIYNLSQFQENVIHNANVWINVLDEKTNVVLWNEAAEKMSGYSATEVIGHDKIWGWLYPDDKYRKKISLKVNAIIKKGEVVEDYETKISCKNGKVKIISWHSSNLTNLQGKIIGSVALGRDITQHKQAEEKLRDSEEYLKILFDYAPDAYYISDLKGNFIDGNLAAERLTGFKKEELIGESFLKLKLLPLVDVPKAIGLLAKNLRGLPTGPDEFILNRKDNSKMAVEISTYLVKIKGRTLVLGITRDITVRKKAEKALLESEERYRAVFENTGTATVVVGEDENISMVNTQYEKLSGYFKEEIENKMKWSDLIAPEDLERVKRYHIERRKAKGKAPTEYEFRMIDKKGALKDIFLKTEIMPDNKRSIASLTDITKRKRAEEELRLHAAIMDNVAEGICLTGLDDFLIKWTNEKFTRMFGYEPGELIGKSVDIINAPLEENKTRASIMHAIRKTGEWHGEVRNIKRDGTYLWCYANISLFNHPEYGKVKVSVNTDINERKLAEDNVKNAKDEMQIILDSVPAIIFYRNTENKIIRASKTLADLLKLSIKDIIGKTIEELFPQEQAEKMKRDDQEVIISRKAKRNILQPYTTPDGIRWQIVDKVPYINKEGKIIGVIGLAKDITEQRKSEQELLQSYQKLKKTMNATIETISKIVEAKDPYTSSHQLKVSQLATAIAKELNLSPDKVEGIRIASLIHDIGKIGLPTEILSKPTKLSAIEFDLIKGHPQMGYNILKSIDFSYPIASIVFQHHERLNGSGYPQGLKGDKILLEARIIGIADTVEAMASHRPYRPALGIDKALEEITQNRVTLYDPEVGDVCLNLFREKGFKFE